MFNKFLSDKCGNMTVMFAASLFVLAGAVGIAVDYAGIDKERSKLQSLTDAATLAAAISGEQDENILQTIAENVVAENNTSGAGLTTTVTVTADNYIRVEISTQYNTVLAGLLGINTIPIKTIAEAPPRSGGKMNIAMVLDVTGSMEGTKIDALKTAATDLATSLEGDASAGNVMVSVIPFMQYVKLPLAFDNASWLEKQPDQDASWQELDLANSTGCTKIGTGENAYYECTNPVYITHDYYATWKGCMGSRTAPLNEVPEFGGNKLQGFVKGGWCHSEILPLTSDMQAVKDNINNMSVGGDTYIPAGLIWGWRSLRKDKPMTQADTPDYNKRAKALILMTDGENVRSYYESSDDDFNGEYHWESGAAAKAEADALTARLCNNIKADNITIYTIAFEVSDQATIDMLRDCASDPDKFFDANNAEQLKNSFRDIGTQLALVRLSK